MRDCATLQGWKIGVVGLLLSGCARPVEVREVVAVATPSPTTVTVSNPAAPTPTPTITPVPVAKAQAVNSNSSEAAPKTITVSPFELIDKVEGQLSAATTEAQCVEIADALNELNYLELRKYRRLVDTGDNMEAQRYNYFGMVVTSLSDAVESKRKGLVQVNGDLGKMYLSTVHSQIAAARQSSAFCSGSYTFTTT